MKMKNVTHTFGTCFLTTAAIIGCAVLSPASLKSQSSVYDNFESIKLVRYHEKGGVLDTAAKNPSVGGINSSPKCGMYVRNAAKKFDNFKMALSGNLTDVEKYATYEGIPPRFKMKIYTSAPAGTLVEILLGSRKGNNDYPAGTHSQYQAYTKTSNQWEELEFLFSQIPQGSETSASQIDQVVLLFNPNSSTSDTYYFDDLTGPPASAAPSGTASINNGQPNQNPEAVNTGNPEVTPVPENAEQGNKPKKTKKNKK